MKLDRNLPHFYFEHDLITKVVALVRTGAGAIIDWLSFFKALALINPEILVKI